MGITLVNITMYILMPPSYLGPSPCSNCIDLRRPLHISIPPTSGLLSPIRHVRRSSRSSSPASAPSVVDGAASLPSGCIAVAISSVEKTDSADEPYEEEDSCDGTDDDARYGAAACAAAVVA